MSFQEERLVLPCLGIAEALRKSYLLYMACHNTHTPGVESQAVLAQSHLSFQVIATWAEALVLGAIACTAIQQWFLLEVALRDVFSHSWVEVAHLRLCAVASNVKPGKQIHKVEFCCVHLCTCSSEGVSLDQSMTLGKAAASRGDILTLFCLQHIPALNVIAHLSLTHNNNKRRMIHSELQYL